MREAHSDAEPLAVASDDGSGVAEPDRMVSPNHTKCFLVYFNSRAPTEYVVVEAITNDPPRALINKNG